MEESPPNEAGTVSCEDLPDSIEWPHPTDFSFSEGFRARCRGMANRRECTSWAILACRVQLMTAVEEEKMKGLSAAAGVTVAIHSKEKAVI